MIIALEIIVWITRRESMDRLVQGNWSLFLLSVLGKFLTKLTFAIVTERYTTEPLYMFGTDAATNQMTFSNRARGTQSRSGKSQVKSKRSSIINTLKFNVFQMFEEG